jgi:monofunctional glycosyltransferase
LPELGINDMRRKRRSRSIGERISKYLLLAALLWLGSTLTVVLLLRWVDPPTSSFMIGDRLAAWRHDDSNYRLQQRWVNWDGISADAKLAVIAAEDQRFADHFGFDFVEIGNALVERDHRASLRGASTITQQTAKNLFLWSGQSWLRKMVEAYFTVLLESCWPKRRILEVYLNVAQFGRGVFGVGAASERYFRQPPARLNRAQSALLAAVLPNPLLFKVIAPSPYVRTRQLWIIGQMRGLGGVGYLDRLDRPGRSARRSARFARGGLIRQRGLH